MLGRPHHLGEAAWRQLGVPNSWMVRQNPSIKWMITREVTPMKVEPLNIPKSFMCINWQWHRPIVCIYIYCIHVDYI